MKKKHGMSQRIQKGLSLEDKIIRRIDEERLEQREQGFDMRDHVEVNENGRVWSF